MVVPSAESPSTINSSVLADSSERQSDNLVGSEELSSAFFRRCKSLWARAEILVLEAFAIFSSIKRPVALSILFVVLKNAFISSATTWPTIFAAAAVPNTSLVCPSN